MIVLDASAAVLAVLNDGESRRIAASEQLAAPHLIDSEVTSGLHGQILRGEVSDEDATEALDRWSRLGLRRFPARDLLARMWELRHNLTPYDATYVALAEALRVDLVTGDGPLANAPGPTCAIRVVRS